MTQSTSSPSTERGDAVSGVEIVFDDIVKTYAGTSQPAVDHLSLTIPAGEIVMFVGPSGCGKTTSLKMINRLHEPTSGTITIDGEDIRAKNADELRRHVGYVIQGGSLFPHMTVKQNIGLVPGLLGWDKQRTAERVDELLDLVGLKPDRYRDRFPRELSGGQQQRVGVARGLAADPPVILMDEPFGAVDPITRQRLQDELLSIQEELRKTIVCVTHDIDEAVKLGDRILILTEGAKIAQYDTPENVLAAPANTFVEDFVGAGSALKSLSLSRVAEVDLYDQTSVKVGESVADAKQRATSAGHTSVVVLDEQERPVDWLWLRALQGETVREPADERDLITISQQATLNDALDSMLVSTHDGVPVTGAQDRYVGVATFSAVTSLITSKNQQAQETSGDAIAQAPDDADLEHATAAPADTEGS
ncbi:ABC transporter ATP-binding protein [Serinicoccus kebangsaanensis]|uniref:ABC transporter ATP-binding protein n=1 Tax=Serinicoccus kebangsaanensis TaxID=2602069 RepID=UPI00124C096B|nr:ABC transporter ATP-binding protein [Serinicoccus kebangsaanensis]